MNRVFPLVASVYAVHGDRVLMVLHSGFGKWVPPGGHVEPGETLAQAARREAVEETGLEIDLLSAGPVIHPPDANATPEPVPFYADVLVEGFALPTLVHYYWGRVTSIDRQPRRQESEVDSADWLNAADVSIVPTFDQVRSLAAFALARHPDVVNVHV